MHKIYSVVLLIALLGFVGFILTNDCSVCACVICEDGLSDGSINNSVNDSQEVVFESISPDDFSSLLSEDVVLLDIRTSQEFDSGRIEDALNLDFYSSSFKSDLNSLDKNETYLIYCRSGSRTSKTLDIMEELGFREVYDLRGGINNWKNSDFSVVFS